MISVFNSSLQTPTSYDRLLSNQYIGLASAIFANLIVRNSYEYYYNYNVVASKGGDPSLITNQSNVVAERVLDVNRQEIQGFLFRESLKINERDFLIAQEKGNTSRYHSFLVEESIRAHLALIDQLTFLGEYQDGLGQNFIDPYGLLKNEKVLTLENKNWVQASGTTKANDLMELIQSVEGTDQGIDTILISKKVFRNLNSGEISESGKKTIQESIKNNLALSLDTPLFFPTELLDTPRGGHVVVFNSCGSSYDLFLGYIPHLRKDFTYDEDQFEYRAFVDSIYSGLRIYRDNAFAKMEIQI